MGLIIFIIIIVVIVANANSKGKNSKGNANRPVQNRPVQNRPIKNDGQISMNEYLEQKYTQPKQNILNRAKATVAEDFNEVNEKAKTVKKTNSKKASNAYNRQKELSQKVNEKLNIEQNFCKEEESELIKVVEDLMIKGPDTTLTFERDFISEGLDMLNSIQA